MRAAIADICEVNPRLDARPSADELVAFVGMADLDETAAVATDGELRPYAEVAKGYTPFVDGDLLVAKITPCFQNNKIGQARTSTRLAFGSTEFHVLRPRAGVADARYLLHMLRQKAVLRHGEMRMTGAGGQRRVPARFFEELTVPLPPVEEQRRIAAVLDAADGLRAKRREALERLETLTQAIFIEMFGPVGLSGEMMTLGDALADAEVFTDGDWVESKDQDPMGEVRLTQLADIGVGIWLNKSERYMNRATADRLRCTFLEPGDVLVARMPDPIGRACIFPGDRRPSVTAVDVCIIRPSPESVDARWLVEALNLPRTRAQIERRATGSTRSRISRRNLAKVDVALPPLDAQREFTYRAVQVERSRGSQLSSVEHLDNLFSSLQQRAFRGEL